jgi:hypothetical protein
MTTEELEEKFDAHLDGQQELGGGFYIMYKGVDGRIKNGIVSEEGELVVPFEYDFMDALHDYPEDGDDGPVNRSIGIIGRVRNNEKFKDGKLVQPQRIGYFNTEGKLCVPPIYRTSEGFCKAGVYFPDEKQEGFDEYLAIVELDGKYGFVDRNGKVIIPIIYQSVRDFFNGLASAQLNDKWGFIDRFGKEVIPFIYEAEGHFYSEFSPAKLNGKAGLINNKGKEIIPFKYDGVFYDEDEKEWSAEIYVRDNSNGKEGYLVGPAAGTIKDKYDEKGNKK